MNEHSQKATQYFQQGYNCAQAVVATFCDELAIDRQTAMMLASSFGGGMGRLREVCGAVSGMFIVAGLKYGYCDFHDKAKKDEHYRLIQQLAQRFIEENGTIICRELLNLPKGADSPISEERTQKYYKRRPCKEMVGCAALIMDEYIKSRNLEDNKMKIAVASEGEMITGHFGHCQNFNIYEVANNQIIGTESIPNPGHKPGFLPNYLNEIGINVIISGGMGGGAVEIFNEKGIEVITGAVGNAKLAAMDYLAGKLQSTGSVCHEHQHHDECEG